MSPNQPTGCQQDHNARAQRDLQRLRLSWRQDPWPETEADLDLASLLGR